MFLNLSLSTGMTSIIMHFFTDCYLNRHSFIFLCENLFSFICPFSFSSLFELSRNV